MDLRKAAIEYTTGQYFSPTEDKLTGLQIYELLKECLNGGSDEQLVPWAPFENWDFDALLEQIEKDVITLEALLKQAQDSAGVPE